jgi:uncharacterized protein (DUF433 family)
MSKVVSMRLTDEQIARLQRVARSLNRTQAEAAALLLEEALRGREFPFIEFRDSAIGRQAYLQGSRLTVWQAVIIARSYGGDIAQTAAHLEITENQVAALLAYASAYPTEVEATIVDNYSNEERIQVLVPSVQIVAV